MKAASLPICRAALAAAACLMTQCAMPPRDAWRIVQEDGLIPYVMGTYDYQPGQAQNQYLATSTPLQHIPTPMPQPVASAPSRPDYAPNRYLAGSYYQPDATPSRSRTESTPRRKAKAEVEVDEAPPEISHKPEPKIVNTPPVKKDKPSEAPAKLDLEDLPFGTPVSGRPGMVNSPFATKDQLVDVTGMSVGETVKCPYSGKLFRVPPGQQASATPPKPSAPPAPEPLDEPKPTAPEPEKPAADPASDKPADKPKA